MTTHYCSCRTAKKLLTTSMACMPVCAFKKAVPTAQQKAWHSLYQGRFTGCKANPRMQQFTRLHRIEKQPTNFSANCNRGMLGKVWNKGGNTPAFRIQKASDRPASRRLVDNLLDCTLCYTMGVAHCTCCRQDNRYAADIHTKQRPRAYATLPECLHPTHRMCSGINNSTRGAGIAGGKTSTHALL
jgi:hypothetical protein